MSSSVGRLVQLLVLSAACFALTPPSAYGQSLREQLLGTWTLVSLTRFVGDVEEPGLMGRDAIGRIIFAPDGHMCFNAMRANRSTFGSRDFQAGTPEEKTAAYDSYTGYCGRYEVNEQERSVGFRLELSSYPQLDGNCAEALCGSGGQPLEDQICSHSFGRETNCRRCSVGTGEMTAWRVPVGAQRHFCRRCPSNKRVERTRLTVAASAALRGRAAHTLR